MTWKPPANYCHSRSRPHGGPTLLESKSSGRNHRAKARLRRTAKQINIAKKWAIATRQNPQGFYPQPSRGHTSIRYRWLTRDFCFLSLPPPIATISLIGRAANLQGGKCQPPAKRGTNHGKRKPQNLRNRDPRFDAALKVGEDQKHMP